jgi:competence protein ComEA
MLLVLSVSVALVARQGAQSSTAKANDPLPDGKGKDVVLKVCSDCHDAKTVASVRLTREGWSTTIADMVQRGAQGTDDELASVLDYLATNFKGEGVRPLNVNTASQIDLETVAGLLRKEAAAVIEYREKNGAFKTLDDMKNVPGLDFKKIDSRREYLVAIKP